MSWGGLKSFSVLHRVEVRESGKTWTGSQRARVPPCGEYAADKRCHIKAIIKKKEKKE